MKINIELEVDNSNDARALLRLLANYEGQSTKEAPQEAQESAESAQAITPPPKQGEVPSAPAPAPAHAVTPEPDPGAPDKATVRKTLNALIKAGQRDRVREILGQFGATGLTELLSSDYAKVIEAAEAALAEVS